MTENKRETGARIAKPSNDPEPTDRNAGRPQKRGLTQKTDETHDRTRQSDQAGMKGSPQSDARGAGARSQADASSDGVASAEPRVLSGKKSGDATFHHTYDGIDKE